MKKAIIPLLFTLVSELVFSVVYAEGLPKITVYKSPSCGCCTAWVDYMRNNDFVVESVDLATLSDLKILHHVMPELQSCHTALVDGYVIEGHVPADDVKRLLEEKPEVVGLTAPGMPNQSPGMNSIIPKNYTVYSFDDTGNVEVYSEY